MSQEEQTIKLDQRDVLDAAMTAGHILLENGAEIFRVEETIDRICHHFGVQSENAFVLSNGIFLTSGDEHEKRFARWSIFQFAVHSFIGLRRSISSHGK